MRRRSKGLVDFGWQVWFAIVVFSLFVLALNLFALWAAIRLLQYLGVL